MKVCVHAQGTQSIKDSVLAGVDSIDHGYHLTEETAEMMKERGITHKLTSLAKGYVSERRKEEGVLEIVVKKRSIFSYDVKKRALQLSMKKGVNVVACTDAEGDDNGVINAMEPAHWVYAGATPMDAIVAMTRKPAELLGIEAGTIQVGKLADILVVDGNPLDKIEILQERARIKMIMKQGRIEVRR